MSKKIAAALANLQRANAVNQARYLAHPKTYFTCAHCGIPAICKPSHLRLKRYCSKLCMAEGYKTRLSGEANPNFRRAGIKTCCGCGDVFRGYSKTRKYCSTTCYAVTGRAENARMNGRKNGRGSGRIDANQREIVDALRSVGASVLCTNSQGQGFPDLVVGWRGINFLMEVKNPHSAYGRRGFNKNQIAFNATWKGAPPVIVRTLDEALRTIGATSQEI